MDEHPHPYGALYHQKRAEALEATLTAIRDFEPVTNGDYAIEVAMPKMREIAMRALVSTHSGEGEGMNHRSAKIVEYAQHLDSQIEGLQHTLSVRSGELAIAQMGGQHGPAQTHRRT